MALPRANRRRILFAVFAPAVFILAIVLPLQARPSQVTCDPALLRFNKVVVGQNATLPVTITNHGPTNVTIGGLDISSSAFNVGGLRFPLVLSSGQKADFTVTFSPTTTGKMEGVILFLSDQLDGAVDLPMNGIGVNDWPLSADPPALAFGDVAVGSHVTLPLAVVNSGDTSATISSGRLSGSGFSLSGVTLPLTLDPGQRYTFNVTFSPQATGQTDGNILASGPLNPVLTVPLSGNGTTGGQLILTPLAIGFGNVTVGDTGYRTGMLSAVGTSVTVSSVTSSSSEFEMKGLSLPLTLVPGQSVSYTARFAPQENGNASATFSFTSNATNSPGTQPLSGTGTPPNQHSVSLSWDASTSQVIGYNVYRSNTSRGPYARINAVLDPTTTYLDDNIAAGQLYFYVATAVNSVGQESGFSNQVRVMIPLK